MKNRIFYKDLSYFFNYGRGRQKKSLKNLKVYISENFSMIIDFLNIEISIYLQF